MKEYKIKTLKDIINAVNENNVEGFLKDFSQWLQLVVEVKKNESPFIKVVDSELNWRDDGEYGKIKEVTFATVEDD